MSFWCSIFLIGCIHVAPPVTWVDYDPTPCPTDFGAMSRVEFIPSQGNGIAGDFQSAASSPPQGSGKPSYDDSSYGSENDRTRIQELSNLQENERRQIVNGAMFLAGVCFIAYLVARTR